MIAKKILELGEKIIKQENIKPITIQLKNVRKGRAIYKTRKIILPKWIFNTLEEYQIYYMIHEVSHFINYDKNNGKGHSKEFKAMEQALLKEYNINIIYAKAYPKYLYDNIGFFICNGIGLDTQKDYIKFQCLDTGKLKI